MQIGIEESDYMNRVISAIFCLTLAGTLFLGGMITMTPSDEAYSADTQPTDWEKMKKEAEAKKAALDAEKALIESQKALKEANDPAKKAMDDKIAQAKAAKEVADADKAAADARKAEADASQAALKAQIGEVTATGYKGGVELKDKPGAVEAALLAAKAVKTAAQEITKALPNEKGTILLYASSDVPNFQALIAFRAQNALVTKAFTDAQNASNTANDKAPPPSGFKVEFAAPLAVAGLTLDAVNKLFSFFKTDYTVGNVELSLDDSLLIHALAGLISGSNNQLTVKLPATYNPDVFSDPAAAILIELTNLSYLRYGATNQMKIQEQLSTYYTEKANKEADATNKSKLQEQAKFHKDAADAWKAAIGLFDGFLSKLTTSDDKGVAPLTNVIRESVVAKALSEGNFLLLVKLQKSGGAYYTKNNIVTAFGGMPFYHMGGVVASFVLMDGRTGAVLKSGVVPVHGGFVQADDLPQELKKNP